MWRTRHDMNLYTADRRADKALNDHGVLISLVLHEESVLGVVNQAGDPFPAIASTPDEVGVLARVEFLAVPVGFKTSDDFVDFVFVRGNDGIVTRHSEIFRLPVERLYKGCFVVENERFFVRDAELGIAVLDLNA